MQVYQQRTGVDQDKLKWLTHQLFQVMSLDCIGDALSHVKSVKDDLLVGRVPNPEQVKNIMEVTVAVERWEAWTKDNEESTGTKVPEVAKVYAIKQAMPAELQHDMQRLSSQIQTYKQARAYIMDQVLTRRDPWFGDEKKTKSGGPVPMDLDALHMSQKSGEHVDAMGSGEQPSNAVGDEQSSDTAELNGLRKGGFPGKCHHCGQFGHKISEKDEEVAKTGGKGKGKNSWEYSAEKGNTHSWSPWWQGEHPGKGWNQKGGHSCTSGKSSGKGSDSKGGKRGKGSKGMYWLDTVPENEWDWNGGSSTSPAMFNFEASKLPGPPGSPLRNRFQELVSDDESEDETHLQQQLPSCCPTTTHGEFGLGNKKNILKVIPGVDVPMTPMRSSLNPLIAEPVDMDIHPLVSDRWCRTDTKSGWRKITTVMDSGASDSCAPPSLAPEVEIRESVGSRTGQKYNAASGKSLSNLGEKCLHMVTEEGKHTRRTWQIADISRPLSSVRQICKKGNKVIFGMYGGVIQNLETGDETHFGVEDNIYTMSLWIPPSHEGVFHRQG